MIRMNGFFPFRRLGAVFCAALACLLLCPGMSNGQDELKEFEETLNRVSQDIKKARDNKNNQIGTDFSKRLMELDFQGKKIQRKLTGRGVSAKEINIPKYLNIIRMEWGNYQDNKTNKGHNNEKPLNTTANIASDEAVVELRKLVNKIRDMGGLSPQTGDVKVVKDESATASGAKETTPNDKNVMFKRLQEMRDAIIKSDTQVGGLDPSTVKEYQETLTTRQKKKYNDLVAKYTSRGWERDKAEESAVLELHGLIKNNSEIYTEKELLTLMKKLGEME